MELNAKCFPPALTTSLTTTSNTSTRWTSRGSPSVTLSAPKNWQTNMFRSSILISDLFAKNSFFHSCTNKEKLHFFWNVCSGFQFWSFPRTRPPRSQCRLYLLLTHGKQASKQKKLVANKDNSCLELFVCDYFDEVVHQDSTYHFINVAPQWQSFNGRVPRVFKSSLSSG